MLKTEKLSPFEAPGRCVLFPHVIQDDEGFYIGMDLDGLTAGTMRATVAVKSIKELARREGMVARTELEEAQAQADALQLQLDESEAEVHRLEAELESMAGLRRHGFEIQKKMGRPPKKAKEAA